MSSIINYDDDFFYSNIVKTNELCARLLLISNLLGPALAFCSYLELFNISYKFCIEATVMCTLFTLLQYFSQRFSKNQYYVMYQGLTLTTIFVCFLGTNRYVGVYISYALVPFFSCMKKSTLVQSENTLIF